MADYPTAKTSLRNEISTAKLCEVTHMIQVLLRNIRLVVVTHY